MIHPFKSQEDQETIFGSSTILGVSTQYQPSWILTFEIINLALDIWLVLIIFFDSEQKRDNSTPWFTIQNIVTF